MENFIFVQLVKAALPLVAESFSLSLKSFIMLWLCSYKHKWNISTYHNLAPKT